MNSNPSYLGHRSRVKEKFLKNDSNSFYDYELLELLLFSANPRKDVKPIAKKLLEKLGSLGEVINANSEVLQSIENINDGTIIALKIAKEINIRISKQEIKKKIIFTNWQELINYCNLVLGSLKTEQFRILFLDKKHAIISDEIFQNGGVESVMVDIKEIAKKSLILTASSIILIHNHPSGDVNPSKFDIINTNKIIEALKPLNIKVYDHIIIAAEKYYSFKNNGLI